MAIESVNSTTFKADGLGDVKPKVLIGGTDASKFVPNINASFSFNKDDEFFININRSEKIITNQTVEITGGVIKQTVGIERDEIYIDANGKLKWDTVYSSKPPVLKLVYDLTFTPGIEFYYQTELTAAEIAEGCYRPDDIVGSYAVYCNKAHNKYRTGKLCHIPRPFVVDALGKREWCSQVIKDGKLTVTLPKAFMDSATYPVRLDPTFGYTSVGGSTDYWSPAKAAKATSTPASNGTLDSISVHGSCNDTTRSLYVALYSDSSGPATRLAVETTTCGTITTTPGWVTTNISYASITASTQYWIGFTPSAVRLTFSYDSASNELAISTSATLDNPFGVSAYQSQRVSAYATYTEAGGGATAKSETDSGSGADSTKIIVRFGQTDTASGADSLFVKAIIRSSDTASGADSNSVKAYIKPVDSGSGSDTIPLIRANFKLTDAGVNTDGERIFVKTTLTDSGAYVDAINSIRAYLRIDDSGLSSDDLAIFAKLAIGETGTANDLATKGGNAYVALTDSGVGVDSISIRALLGITDSGSGVDGDFAKLTLIISDSGVAVDNVSIKALLALVDSGITSDDIVSYNPSKLLQDYGSFVDSVVVVDSTLPVNHVYTVGDYSSLPVDDTDLETSFIAAQYTDIAVENNSFVDQTALDQYALFQFKEKFANGTIRPTVQCRTKSTLAPSSSTVYLQVYNRTTSAWVTLASNSSALANSVFTLSATVTGTLSDYYDVNFWYSFRLYQLMQ